MRVKKNRIAVFSQSEKNLLSDLDSNQDKRYQKPLYYPYTIGQFSITTVVLKWNANLRTFFISASLILKYFIFFLKHHSKPI